MTTMEFPTLDETLIDAAPRTAVSVAAAATLDLQKIDLTDVALAQFGNWRPAVAKLKADNAVLVLDLSKQTQIDEAKSLRERTINKPMAEARKVSKALKSKLTDTSKSIGEELEALVLAYDEAGKPLTTLIDAAQKVIDDAKEAERQAKERRLTDLRATVDQIMQKWLDRCNVEGITAERIGAGAAMLAALDMPPELADVSAYWTTEKTATVEAMTKLQQAAEAAKVRAAQQAIESATQQIQALQQQVVIAAGGRLGVRQGGTIECIRETLAETEAWVIDEANFGPLVGAAQITMDGAIASIRAMLAEAERRAEQAREDADIDKLTELANDCVARGAQYIEGAIGELDSVLAPTLSSAARVQAHAKVCRERMVALLEAAQAKEIEAVQASTESQSNHPELPESCAEGKAGTPGTCNAEAAPNTEGQGSQLVLKAERESADATDRDAPADASPGVGHMGVGQATDVAPVVGPVPVERDEDGHFWHPHIDWNSVPEDASAEPYLQGLGFDTAYIGMDGDAPDEVVERYFEKGEPNCWEWTPSRPAGEGWFLAAIYDHEDGPHACWLRPAILLQDQSRALTDALASKPDAMLHAREAAAAISLDLNDLASEDDPGPLETSEADAIEPPRRIVLLEPEPEDDTLPLLRMSLDMAKHARKAFTGRFPSQPKMDKAWFEALRQFAEVLDAELSAAIAAREVAL